MKNSRRTALAAAAACAALFGGASSAYATNARIQTQVNVRQYAFTWAGVHGYTTGTSATVECWADSQGARWFRGWYPTQNGWKHGWLISWGVTQQPRVGWCDPMSQ